MPDIVLELTIAAAPDKVFKALTEQPGLEAWWTTHVAAEPRAGAPLEVFFRGSQQVIKMEMCTLEPGRKVVWGVRERVAGWGGSQFTWDLSPVDNSTKVLFGYRDFPASADGNLPGLTYAWAVNLTSLKDYLEKGKGNPKPGRTVEAEPMDKLNAMHGKVVMVTAGTGGIGKETATELAKLGATVVVVGRDPQRGQTALDDIRAQSRNPHVDLMLADLSSQAEVAHLASQFRAHYDRLHVLVNNIGGVQGKRIETVDGIETTFATTYLNVFLLTALLLPMLKVSRPSRIVNVNSSVHRMAKLNFDDLQSRQRYQPPRAYQRAKLANVLFTYELSRRLAGTGVTTNCADPGMADTPGTRASQRDMPPVSRLIGLLAPLARAFMGTTTIEKAARSSVYLAASPDVEGVTGQYFSRRTAAVKSSKASYDQAAAQQLWTISAALVAPHLKTEPIPA